MYPKSCRPLSPPHIKEGVIVIPRSQPKPFQPTPAHPLRTQPLPRHIYVITTITITITISLPLYSHALDNRYRGSTAKNHQFRTHSSSFITFFFFFITHLFLEAHFHDPGLKGMMMPWPVWSFSVFLGGISALGLSFIAVGGWGLFVVAAYFLW